MERKVILQIKIGLILSSILLVNGCKKPEEFAGNSFPFIRLLTPEAINSGTGFRLTGKIFHLGKVPIVDHGFMWSRAEIPIENAELFTSLGEKETLDEFSIGVNTGLTKGAEYKFWCYVKTNDYTIYSESKRILSTLGSEVPQIISIIPETATWNDTVEIKLKNHDTNQAENNQIFFSDIKAEILSITDESIFTIIPGNLFKASPEVVVDVGELSSLPKYYQLQPPEIHQISPSYGVSGDTISITGKYFRPQDNAIVLRVYLGPLARLIIPESSTSFEFVVPKRTAGTHYLRVVALDQSSDSVQFDYKNPLITLIDPIEGMVEDTINISGDFFGYNMDDITIYFDDTPGTLLSSTYNSAVVTVPFLP